jgi:histidinol-phosphatase
LTIYSLAAWDLAPMAVLAEEAGGRFSVLDGSRRLDGRIGFVSNGLLHEELLTLLREGVRDVDGAPEW